MRTAGIVLLLLVVARADEEDARKAQDAFALGAVGDDAAVPTLVAQLRQTTDHGLRAALLDALIRIDARVDAKDLVPLHGEFPDQVIILLAGAPAANREALLRLMDAEKCLLRWMAIANVLAEARQPGVAGRILMRHRIRFEVFVLPRRNMMIGLGGGGEGADRNPEVRAKHEPRWRNPPYARYTITDRPRRGDRFLAGTSHRIFWRRETFRRGAVELLDEKPHVDLPEFCLGAIAELLPGGRREVSVRPSPSRVLYWEGEKKFLEEIDGLRRNYELLFEALLDRLVTRELMTAEERERIPTDIEWVVKDMSPGGSLPIPKIPKKGD